MRIPNLKWKIEYLSEIEQDLDNLNKQQLKSVTKELKLLELCGNSLRLPHSRALGNGLLELRERNFGYRIYYTFLENRVIVLLQVGDKSNQQTDIRIAYTRLKKLEKHHENQKF